MIYVAVVIGVVLIVVLLSPFWVGPGGLLVASSSINSKEALEARKEAILKRYIEDEHSHTSGALSRRAWEGRQSFLVHRYVDAARRLDYLVGLEKADVALTPSDDKKGGLA